MIGGERQRVGRQELLGGLLLLHWFFVISIKSSQGRVEEAFWLSHVSLLLSAMALLTGARWLLGAVLAAIALPHGVWLADAAGLGLVGRSPLLVTSYLTAADRWDWIATSHHFYLLPLLFRLRCDEGRARVAEVVTGCVLVVVLCLAGRVVAGPEANINYAYAVMPALNEALLNALNTLPVVPYLIILCALSAFTVIWPGWLLVRLAAHRSTIREDDRPSEAAAWLGPIGQG